MTKTFCDMCKKPIEEEPVRIQIGSNAHELCSECNAGLVQLLDGTGTPVPVYIPSLQTPTPSIDWNRLIGEPLITSLNPSITITNGTGSIDKNLMMFNASMSDSADRMQEMIKNVPLLLSPEPV